MKAGWLARFATQGAVGSIAAALTAGVASGAQSGVPSAIRDVCPYRPGALGLTIQDWVVLVALTIALLIVGVIAFGIKQLHSGDFGQLLGVAQWDLKDSWVSTITAAGAVLGGAFSTAGLFPTGFETRLLCNAGYASMSAFFGVLTVMALVVYNACRITVKLPPPPVGFPLRQLLAHAPGAPADPGFPLGELLDFVSSQLGQSRVRGYVSFFLVASTITLWSVYGQLITLAMLVWELHSASAVTWVILIILWLSIGFAIVFIPRYASRSMGAILDERLAEWELVMSAEAGHPRPHRWSLL